MTSGLVEHVRTLELADSTTTVRTSSSVALIVYKLTNTQLTQDNEVMKKRASVNKVGLTMATNKKFLLAVDLNNSDSPSDNDDIETTGRTKGKHSTTAEPPAKIPDQTNTELRGIIGTIAELSRATNYDDMVGKTHTQLATILQTTGHKAQDMDLICGIGDDVSQAIYFSTGVTSPRNHGNANMGFVVPQNKDIVMNELLINSEELAPTLFVVADTAISQEIFRAYGLSAETRVDTQSNRCSPYFTVVQTPLAKELARVWRKEKSHPPRETLQSVIDTFDKAMLFGWVFSLNENGETPQDDILILTSAKMLDYVIREKYFLLHDQDNGNTSKLDDEYSSGSGKESDTGGKQKQEREQEREHEREREREPESKKEQEQERKRGGEPEPEPEAEAEREPGPNPES